MWETYKLGELCDTKSGGTPSRRKPAYYNGDIPWAKIGDLESSADGLVTETEESITTEGLDAINNRIFQKGTLLFAMYGSVGKVAFAGQELATNQAILGINPKPNKELDLKYLKYYLQSKKEDLIHGARGVALKNLSASIIKDLDIPLPPLPIQKKIAQILDLADEHRQKTKALIEKYDELAQSIFLDMFGDPVTNPKGWEEMRFEELGELNRGKSKHRPRNDPKLLGGEYPLIQTGDIANSGGYITDYSSTYSELGLKQSRMWPSGTLCITIAANIAKTGILTFDSCFPDSVVGFIPNQLTNNEYIQYWLGFLQKTLEEKAPESAQKNINLRILRELKLPVPNKGQQEEFATKVRNLQSQKALIERQISSSENLFQSLLQKAFKGELVSDEDLIQT